MNNLAHNSNSKPSPSNSCSFSGNFQFLPMFETNFVGLAGPSLVTLVLTAISVFLSFLTLPLSLLLVVKVVQEFERAVIFRLGRLLPCARGPGVFFVLPCVDRYEIIDMRTQTFNVPPQEVKVKLKRVKLTITFLDSHKRQCHNICDRNHVLQS